MLNRKECVDNGGISGIQTETCKQHLAFGAPAGQESGMFRRLQIYSLYLKAKRKACLLGSTQVWLLLGSWKTSGTDGWGSGLDLGGAQ